METNQTGGDIDRQRLELDRRKVELEELRYKHDNRFFNKNFGAIITGVISTATIVVSVTQLYISSNYNSGQLNNEAEKNRKAFAFEVAKFLMQQRDEIITNEVGKAKYFRTVVISSFPPEIAAQVATSLRDTFETQDAHASSDTRATSDVRTVWAESAIYSQSKLTPQPVSDGKSKLTVDLLAAEFKELGSDGARNELKAILDKARDAGILNKDEVDIYLALVLQNTNILRMKTENMNYSAPRLLQVWPRLFNPGNVQDFANKPEQIANKVYGDRLGNNQPGDGWKYIGRGYMQITGRAAYADIGQALDVNLLDQPEKLLELDINAKASALLFSRRVAPAKAAGNLDIVRANVAINGGLVGLDTTKAIYERIRRLTPTS